eukprot:TRINITY_DN11717_c0_g1_i1.p1 TRINITY_DN11717_c0_g1~~TRINITY_DN11717_c0_g1_i1.p1  ORF type:complete len:69 (-),score=4.76 TRINITY_DN11717_c0_g1_i1:43-249(-)
MGHPKMHGHQQAPKCKARVVVSQTTKKVLRVRGVVAFKKIQLHAENFTTRTKTLSFKKSKSKNVCVIP